MAAAGITIVYRFPYRGQDEEWSQRYHFVGDAPEDDAGWRDLFDDLRPALQDALDTNTRIVAAYGYEDTDDDAVWSFDATSGGLTLYGNITLTTGCQLAPGDTAAWMRWYTGRRNTRNRKIYLRKYWHGIHVHQDAGQADELCEAYRDALENAAAEITAASGDWPGIAGPDGEPPADDPEVSMFATTRTLKRRGPRP